MFDDMSKLEGKIRSYKADDKKRLALEYLNGNKVQRLYRPMPIAVPEMAMAAAPMAFDAGPVAMAAAPAGGGERKAKIMYKGA